MNRRYIHAFGSLVLSTATLASIHGQELPALAIRNVTIVDVADGSLQPEQTVLVTGNRIAAVGPTEGLSVPSGAKTLEASGSYLIPGLWDMHVHSAASLHWHFPALLAHGVTGVRNMHSSANDALALIAEIKDRLEAGELLGPRFYANGPVVDGIPAIHRGSIEIGGEADARATVDSLRDRGADFVKVYDRLSREAYFAVMDQARLRGLAVVGHLPSRVLPEEAAEAGQSTIEHLSGMQYGCSTRATQVRAELKQLQDSKVAGLSGFVAYSRLERTLYDSRVPSLCAATIEAYRRHDVAIVPTLVIYRNESDPETVLAGDEIRLVPADVRGRWEQMAGPGPGEELRALMRPTIPLRLENVRLLKEAGVSILAGTDLGNSFLVPGVSLHQELDLLVQAGLTTLEVLQAATVNPARVLGTTESFGTVAAGKLADLVLLDANPLQDIRNTERIRAVVVDGRVLDRDALDAMLAAAEDDAKVDRGAAR